MSVRIILVSGRGPGADQMIKVIDELKLFGVEADICSDFSEFGTLWKKGKFAMALIDLDDIPFGGYDPYFHFEGVTSSIPSVFVSERGNLEKWTRALEAGAVSFVTRPFQPRTLSRFILRLLRKQLNT